MTDAERITHALSGHWTGRSGVCRCPAHDDRTPSLSVAEGHDGRLLLRCFTGCSFEDVVAALRWRGLLKGTGRTYRPGPVEVSRREAAERAEREKRIAQARATWNEALPIERTLAEAYLRRRAITGPLPPNLRFHKSCWHKSAKRLSAMVAAVVDLRGALVAVHRTYLAEPGIKAPIDPPRAMLGPVSGSAVRLSDGAGPLVVAEGIETALSLRDGLVHLEPRAWAALSAGGVARLELPKPAGELVVASDPDTSGRKAAETLARRAWAAGWRVKVLEPPAAGDWNAHAQTVAGIATVAGPEARISEGAR